MACRTRRDSLGDMLPRPKQNKPTRNHLKLGSYVRSLRSRLTVRTLLPNFIYFFLVCISLRPPSTSPLPTSKKRPARIIRSPSHLPLRPPSTSPLPTSKKRPARIIRSPSHLPLRPPSTSSLPTPKSAPRGQSGAHRINLFPGSSKTPICKALPTKLRTPSLTGRWLWCRAQLCDTTLLVLHVTKCKGRPPHLNKTPTSHTSSEPRVLASTTPLAPSARYNNGSPTRRAHHPIGMRWDMSTTTVFGPWGQIGTDDLRPRRPLGAGTIMVARLVGLITPLG